MRVFTRGIPRNSIFTGEIAELGLFNAHPPHHRGAMGTTAGLANTFTRKARLAYKAKAERATQAAASIVDTGVVQLMALTNVPISK